MLCVRRGVKLALPWSTFCCRLGMGKALQKACISQGSLEKQNQWEICIYLFYSFIHSKELANMIIEIENSQDLQSKGLRTRREDGSSSSLSLSPKAEEEQCPSLTIREKEWILSCSAFCSIWAFNELDEAHLHWGGQCTLFALIQMLISSTNTLTDTYQNDVSPSV